MTEPRKVYWDSCVWIALIANEPGRVDRCESIVSLAKAGDLQIWTSSFTLAEVYKSRGSLGASLPADKDRNFEEFLQQDFIVEVNLDHEIAVLAKKLLRQFGATLRRCPDAIHLASAVANNLDELHTFDGNNLLPLNGQVFRADKAPLVIREPPQPVIGNQQDLFTRTAEEPAKQPDDAGPLPDPPAPPETQA